MGLVAEYELGCEALPLTDVAAAVPDATMEVSMIPHAEGRTPFVVTATCADPTALKRAFESSAFVAEYVRIGAAGDRYRYQLLPEPTLEEQLGDHLDDCSELRALSATESVVDRIEVTPDGWIQSGWFADRAALEEFRAFWQRNASFRLHRLTRDDRVDDPSGGLTDRQREALATAHSMGYFEIPRRASLSEVADELDISPPSLSERLRRGQAHVVEEVVASGGGTGGRSTGTERTERHPSLETPHH